MNTSINEKPCLVEAKQGFSVSYKNKLLYSKYNPQSTIEKLINDLQLIEDTLILVNSPLLFYGIDLLLKKLPKNCVLVFIEQDKNLYNFSLTEKNSHLNKQNINLSDLFYFNLETKNDLYNLFYNKTFTNKIKSCKRVTKINLSVILNEYDNFYNTVNNIFTNYIAQLWKNRLTLLKLGKLYSKNIFLNLPNIVNSKELIFNSIDKPIFVFGAGLSLDDTVRNIKIENIDLNNFFIICVDSAIKTLLKYNVSPDIVIAVESQLANEKAFIGITNKNYLLISDLTSRQNINTIHKNISYIYTEYTNSTFLDSLEMLKLPLKKFLPLGSVGLYAINLAINLRKDNIPIFFSGLDFSYLKENTHCKNAPARLQKVLNSNRINTITNTSPAYKPGAEKFYINDNEIFSDKILINYATQFIEMFADVHELYNVSQISLFNINNFNQNKIKNILTKDIYSKIKKINNEKINLNQYTKNCKEELNSIIKNYIINEIQQLNYIKENLINSTISIDELVKYINKHDYLFLHFPDGHNDANNNLSFLKRVRNEIDFFLKILNRSITLL